MFNMNYVENLTAVLGTSPVPDAPLEVGLGVGLDEGVDGSNSSGSVVGGGVGRSRGAV